MGAFLHSHFLLSGTIYKKRFLKNGQYKVIENKGSIYTKLHIW